MFDVDLFTLYRWLLAWVATVYCVVVTGQSMWSWYVWLSSSDRYMVLLRRYLLVQTLRMRFRDFWGELIICLLLCVAFALMCKAQWIMSDVERTVSSAHANAITRKS
jgi:hypothetical protein